MADSDLPVPKPSGALTTQESNSKLAATTHTENKSTAADVQESEVVSEALGKENMSKARALAQFLKSGSVAKRLTIMGILVIFVTALIFAIFGLSSNNTPETERLLGQYAPKDMGEVLDFLDNKGYKYRLSGDSVFVDAKEYAGVAEDMLRQGIALPSDNTDIGDSILMTDSGFGVSQRLENERIKHGREIQLARAIEKIDGIERATVLLAIPKDNVFAREKSRPSAAVVVTLKKGAYLSPENVSSIRFMVASSVHNLLSKDVSVTDQMGRLLSSERAEGSETNALQRQFEMHTMREAQYRDKLDTILAPMLGVGNYSAEVDVTLDTTTQEETSQLYNPDSQAVRSETLKEQQGNDEKTSPYGVPGSLSNQPPANASIPQNLRNGTGGASDASSSSVDNRKESREAVRNYEVDTTVRHTVRPTNLVQRLTVSVAVDYVRKTDADGKVSYEPRAQEDLTKIADLVRGGLGLDESRGDFVKVETVSFPHSDVTVDLPWYRQDYFYRLVRVGGAVLVIIFLVLFVIRPMLSRLLKREEQELMDAEADRVQQLDDSSALEGNDDLDLITKDKEIADQLYQINEGGGIEIPNIKREPDLLRAVRTLVSNEPELAAEVLKEWLDQGEDHKDRASQKP